MIKNAVGTPPSGAKGMKSFRRSRFTALKPASGEAFSTVYTPIGYYPNGTRNDLEAMRGKRMMRACRTSEMRSGTELLFAEKQRTRAMTPIHYPESAGKDFFTYV